MPTQSRVARLWLLPTPLLGLLLAQDPTAPWPRTGNLLGQRECRDCHEAEAKAIDAGVHAQVVGAGMPGCETCHGPGFLHGKHSDNDPALITMPKKLPPMALQKLCGQCHREQIEAHGGDPAGFLAAGKNCAACHKVHERVPVPALPGVGFQARTEADARCQAVGAARCVECHPLRADLLARSAHRSLAPDRDPAGCETCHGRGSLHVEHRGLERLITRPDQAADGVATCRSCHEAVDPVEFHWKGRRKPLLGAVTCTTCHLVHAPKEAGAGTPRDGVDPDTGEGPTNELCAKCHAPALDGVHGVRGSIHDPLGRRDQPLAAGCGSCHRGGEAHARAGGKKQLVDSLRGTGARHQLAICGSCHESNEHLRHVRAGSHFRSDVTCLQCHSPTAPAGDARGEAESKCATCHAGVAAQFRQPNHHPVPEGRMHCSDCHEPHGARHKIRDLQLREASCLRCHQQYRGPFVFAHQASRNDGCVICHTPHGASNRRMLQQANSQQNCLQCHGDFPSFHDQTPGALFTNCLACHTEVHGSNHSRYLLR